MDGQLIYLDHNATTPIDPRVLESMMPYLTSNFANANSTHRFGVEAYEAVKLARKQVAGLIGAEAFEIVFTSGATEAINLAIKGVGEDYSNKGKHIITVSTEHSAVLETCKSLEEKGFEITVLPVKPDGFLDMEIFRASLRPDTILVSVMMVNNETGVIQPIKQIAALIHEAGALFMTDATQAVGKIPLDVDAFGVDLLCMSGHKMYAPKGIGALYIRQRQKKLNLPALIHGGGQEKGYRSGTLNVPGIVALGTACSLAQKEMSRNEEHTRALRDYLEGELLKIEGTRLNGNPDQRIYTTSNILFEGLDSDAMMLGLSTTENGNPIIAVSKGSACSDSSIEPSHVLTAMGLDERSAFSCLRFSPGKFNTKEEIDLVIKLMHQVTRDLRALVY